MTDLYRTLSPVRPQWLTTIVTLSQTIAGQSQVTSLDDVEPWLNAYLASLPAPANQVERLVLRAVLLDVAWQCGRVLHARAHRSPVRRCGFEPAVVLDHFYSSPLHDPCGAFAKWAHAFALDFRRAHPPTAAGRVAKLIRDNFERKWSVAALAQSVHVTPSRLRRQFALQFGVSMLEYQRAVRMMTALEHVPDGKIDAIALQVGYRSRKNFNEAFRKVTGLTPTAFRRLTRERASELVESLGHVSAARSTAADRRRTRPIVHAGSAR